jgi:serine/threonine protein kinase
VYEAITEYGDEQMAIKVLPLYGETRDAARAFVKGWAAVRDIRHPNLLRSERPQPATVRGLDVLIFPLELASGGSFRAWLDDTRVSRLDAQAWANAVVDGLAALAHLAHGLAALHAAGRVHLDVKPENLLRVGDTWKVSDCGFARDIDAARRAGGAGLAEWVGVPTYRSPEQFLAARPQDVGPEADVWSLGVMLFELLDGHPPVQGDDARVRELVSNPNLRIVWETIPAEWQPLAQRCLAHSPALRPTAMEVAAALARFSPEEGRPPAAHSAPPTPAGAPASAGPAPRPVASALERDATPDMARRGTPAPEPLTSGSAGELTLRHGSRRLGPFQIAQVIGESVTRPLGAEHRFFAPDQFRLEPAGGQWFIVPSPEAPNETLLDGRAISERTPLVQGAEVSVGREAKGIRKLPMIVDIT